MATQPLSAAVLITGVCAAFIGTAGCKRDARLADHKLRHPTVGTVTHYGQTLDQNATPEQVTYVLLRAMRDDFLADTKEARDKALDVQFDVCAAGELARQNARSISDAEYIYNVVYHWTPTVAHYMDDINEDYATAEKRFVTKRAKGIADRLQVMTTLRDPDGDPLAQVVLVVTLVRDEGYWRVLHVGFDPTRRSPAGSASAKARSNADTNHNPESNSGG